MKDEHDKVTIDAIGGDEDKVTGRRFLGSQTADRKRSKWETPLWLVQYLELRQKARFDLDAAASATNHKAPAYFTEENNGLEADWSAYRFIYLNPPYDEIVPWVEKVVAEIKRNKHMTVQMVLPDDNSTLWYRLAAINATEIINLIHDGKHSGRVAFIDPDTGQKVNNNNKGSVVFTFTGKGKASRTLYLSRADMEAKVEKEYLKVFGNGSE